MADTVTLTDKEYQYLLDIWELNQFLRREALEQGRLWCQEHKGTETLAEGLKACTVDELWQLYDDVMSGHTWTEASRWMYDLYRRLKAREDAAATAQAALAAAETVMPE